MLHSSLDLPGFVGLALRLVDWRAALARTCAWTGCGLLAWLVLGAWRGRALRPRAEDLSAVAPVFTPLLLRPALTLLALAALHVQPAYPYGFTLPVALTQDWGLGQDLACLATLLAGLLTLPRPQPAPQRSPAAPPVDWAPRSWELGFVAFLAYALLSPARVQLWDGHPGNEPKYLRMAVALGQFGSLDVEPVGAPMERLEVVPATAMARSALARLGAELRSLGRTLARGRSAWSADAVSARPAAHLTVRGPDGGAYHVLAPGPSLLLAPALRLDRALNVRLDRPGRVVVAVLLWNALAAALVAALHALLRAAGVGAGLALAFSVFVGATPPLLFYFHQFYPEVPAALVLTLALRVLLFGRGLKASAWLGLGLLLMPLPFLHQKYLPVWMALVLLAVLVAVERLVPLRALLGLLVPQLVTGVALLAYNLALAGSPRPDALFRALGRTGVGAGTLGQGLLGLAFDARYGLVPYAPWLLLAPAGLLVAQPGARRLRLALPVAGVYYLTVAAAQNWTGSISNLGRFALPLVPLLAACAALALERARRHPGALALALFLAAWTGALAFLLWRDPVAANDCAVLLAQASFADGNSYVPNLLVRSWSDAAPGLWARVGTWLLLTVVATAFVSRASRRLVVGNAAVRTLAVSCALLLPLALGLEHWPTARQFARFATLRLNASAVVLAGDGARVEDGALWAGPGPVELLVRAADPVPALEILGKSANSEGFPPREVPVEIIARLEGRRGNRETLGRVRFRAASRLRLHVRTTR